MSDEGNWLAMGVDWHKECQNALRPDCIVLCCPGVGERELEVARLAAHGAYLADSSNDVRRRVEWRDFIVDASDYFISDDGQPIEPEVGHIIKWNGCVYEVRPADDEPHSQWNDSRKCEYRIRTVFCQRENE